MLSLLMELKFPELQSARAGQAIRFQLSSTWAFASRHQRELLLIALA